MSWHGLGEHCTYFPSKIFSWTTQMWHCLSWMRWDLSWMSEPASSLIQDVTNSAGWLCKPYLQNKEIAPQSPITPDFAKQSGSKLKRSVIYMKALIWCQIYQSRSVFGRCSWRDETYTWHCLIRVFVGFLTIKLQNFHLDFPPVLHIMPISAKYWWLNILNMCQYLVPSKNTEPGKHHAFFLWSCLRYQNDVVYSDKHTQILRHFIFTKNLHWLLIIFHFCFLTLTITGSWITLNLSQTSPIPQS